MERADREGLLKWIATMMTADRGDRVTADERPGAGPLTHGAATRTAVVPRLWRRCPSRRSCRLSKETTKSQISAVLVAATQPDSFAAEHTGFCALGWRGGTTITAPRSR
jgi:hypothetical protein